MATTDNHKKIGGKREKIFSFLKEAMSRKGVDVVLSPDGTELIYTNRKTGARQTTPATVLDDQPPEG